MTSARTYIEQADGTLWLCVKTHDPYGRDIPGREYWVTYCNGPASRGIVGFYTSSVEKARDKLKGF